MDKASSPSEVMTFLDGLFITIAMTVEVTPERLIEVRRLVEQ